MTDFTPEGSGYPPKDPTPIPVPEFLIAKEKGLPKTIMESKTVQEPDIYEAAYSSLTAKPDEAKTGVMYGFPERAVIASPALGMGFYPQNSRLPPDIRVPLPDVASTPTAEQLLQKAASHMQARAATYDKPEGERSMEATVSAFNSITKQNLTEAHGWLLMTLLKMVRDNQRVDPHVDSVEDLVAYASLYGEARLTK